jgi:hypothetical protein
MRFVAKKFREQCSGDILQLRFGSVKCSWQAGKFFTSWSGVLLEKLTGS